MRILWFSDARFSDGESHENKFVSVRFIHGGATMN